MFKAARVAEMPEHHNDDGSFKQGESEDIIVQQWVTAFKQKREDVAAGRCQWKNQPADLTVIDNPANLPSVPSLQREDLLSMHFAGISRLPNARLLAQRARHIPQHSCIA